MAPEIWLKPKGKFIFQPLIFSAYASFREGRPPENLTAGTNKNLVVCVDVSQTFPLGVPFRLQPLVFGGVRLTSNAFLSTVFSSGCRSHKIYPWALPAISSLKTLEDG